MNYSELYKSAHAAGMAAGNESVPVPMVVGSPSSFMGNDLDLSKQTYFVEGGVCGFAWVHLPKAVGPFVKWLKENRKGHKSYQSGWDIWVGEFGQSMQRKEAYASAFAKVLDTAGIDAYADSRMD